jgi:hypothetical protein
VESIDFALAPRRVLRVLLAGIALLVTLSVVGHAGVYFLPDFPLRDALASLFYVAQEASVPTLFSVLQLLAAAVLLAAIAFAHQRAGNPGSRTWYLLAGLVAYLALDESAMIHERFIGPTRGLLGIETGPLLFAWVIPAAIASVVFALATRRFVAALPRHTRRLVISAFVLFVGGALGVELVGSAYASAHGREEFIYTLIVVVEEAVEMAGAAVLVYALLAYIPVGLPAARWSAWVVLSPAKAAPFR